MSRHCNLYVSVDYCKSYGCCFINTNNMHKEQFISGMMVKPNELFNWNIVVRSIYCTGKAKFTLNSHIAMHIDLYIKQVWLNRTV